MVIKLIIFKIFKKIFIKIQIVTKALSYFDSQIDLKYDRKLYLKKQIDLLNKNFEHYKIMNVIKK